MSEKATQLRPKASHVKLYVDYYFTQWVWQTRIYSNDNVVRGLKAFVEVDTNFPDGLQHFCCLRVCHLSKQQRLLDLKSIGSLSPESNPVPMLSQKVISFEEAHPNAC